MKELRLLLCSSMLQVGLLCIAGVPDVPTMSLCQRFLKCSRSHCGCRQRGSAAIRRGPTKLEL